MKRLAVLLLSFLVLAGVSAAAAYFYLQHYLDTPLPIDSDVSMELKPGTSVNRLANDMAKRGWIKSPKLFVLYTRWRGDSGRLRAGEYEIGVGTTPRGFLDQLIDGRVRLHSVTIVEGWTFKQMLAALQKHAAIQVELTDMDQSSIMKKLGFEGQHAEGRFFPDTYHFAKGTTDIALLKQSYAKMEDNLAKIWAARQDNLPLNTPYDALILASIVEKETGLSSERPAIAGVFVRRLNKNMRLQTDPTVIYGLGDSFDGNIRRRDLTRDTPYNTYTRNGLPPTPIALPGLGSLQAVVNPAEGKALYFVATGTGDGSHRFSDTLEAHNEAVQAYLRQLRKRRP